MGQTQFEYQWTKKSSIESGRSVLYWKWALSSTRQWRWNGIEWSSLWHYPVCGRLCWMRWFVYRGFRWSNHSVFWREWNWFASGNYLVWLWMCKSSIARDLCENQLCRWMDSWQCLSTFLVSTGILSMWTKNSFYWTRLEWRTGRYDYCNHFTGYHRKRDGFCNRKMTMESWSRMHTCPLVRLPMTHYPPPFKYPTIVLIDLHYLIHMETVDREHWYWSMVKRFFRQTRPWTLPFQRFLSLRLEHYQVPVLRQHLLQRHPYRLPWHQPLLLQWSRYRLNLMTFPKRRVGFFKSWEMVNMKHYKKSILEGIWKTLPMWRKKFDCSPHFRKHIALPLPTMVRRHSNE